MFSSKPSRSNIAATTPCKHRGCVLLCCYVEHCGWWKPAKRNDGTLCAAISLSGRSCTRALCLSPHQHGDKHKCGLLFSVGNTVQAP